MPKALTTQTRIAADCRGHCFGTATTDASGWQVGAAEDVALAQADHGHGQDDDDRDEGDADDVPGEGKGVVDKRHQRVCDL